MTQAAWITSVDQIATASDASLRRSLLTCDGAGSKVKERVLEELLHRHSKDAERFAWFALHGTTYKVTVLPCGASLTWISNGVVHTEFVDGNHMPYGCPECDPTAMFRVLVDRAKNGP